MFPMLDPHTFRLAAAHEALQCQWKPVLWGELCGVSLADLLNILSHGRRSGLLLVRTGDGAERMLTFLQGEVVAGDSTSPAEADDPHEVCYGLLQAEQGNFSFLRVPEATLQSHGDGLHAQELLLEGLRRLDEEGRPSDDALRAATEAA